MQALEPPDRHHLSAAQGWLELGCHRDAEEELAKIGSTHHRHPEVLQVQYLLQAKKEQWQDCLELGELMVELEPDEPCGWINRANAFFYLKRYQDAIEALVPALERFPENPLLYYNLSCYNCKMGKLETALDWFKRALALGDRDRLTEMGLKDPDLAELWDSIRPL